MARQLYFSDCYAVKFSFGSTAMWLDRKVFFSDCYAEKLALGSTALWLDRCVLLIGMQ